MNRDRRFSAFIIGGFSFLIVLIIAMSLLGWAGLDRTRTLFGQVYRDAVQTLVKTEQANADLIAAHRAMKDVALSRSDTQLEAALADFAAYDASISDYFSFMRQADPDNADLLRLINAYEEWAPIRARTVEYARKGQYEMAAENTRTAGAEQVRLISGIMRQMVDRHREAAGSAFSESENASAISGRFLLWMALLASLSAVLISVYIRGRLLRYRIQLHEETEKLQITFNSIGDGIITTDTHAKVIGLNKVAEEFTGWTIGDAYGQPFELVFDITNAFTGERAKDPVQEVLTKDAICLLENHTILTSKDGTQRHIADSAAPVKDGKGHTTGVVMIFRDVTARKISEKLLKESELRFRTIFEQAPLGICLSDSVTGRIIDVNDTFAAITGRSKNELREHDWMSVTHASDLPEDLALSERLNAGLTKSYRLEKRYIKPDGSIVWTVMSVALISDTHSENPMHLCMIQDITQQKLAENELKISEHRLKTAQAIANVGNWELDLKTTTMWASEQAFRIYGFPYREDAPFLPLKEAQASVAREDRPRMDDALRLLLTENRPYDVQFSILRADSGVRRIIRSTAVAERDGTGRPLKVTGIIQDITELKTAEQSLARSNIMLEATLRATAEGIEALDLNGNLILFNDQFRKMWDLPAGVTTEEAYIAVSGQISNVNKALTSVHDLVKQLGAEPFRELQLKDGRTIERHARPIQVDGKITGYVLSYRDISEKKRWEQALLGSEARHRAMIANISDTIAVLDTAGRVAYISPNLSELFGWRQEDFIGNDPARFVHPDDLDRVQQALTGLYSVRGGKTTLSFRLMCRNSSFKFIYLTAVNMTSDLNIGGILMNFHDISESKKRENEILYLNYHDLLTGLYNRAFFEEECVRLDSRRQLPVSVIMGDINGLKLINDAFGHREGDKLLVEIAKILSANCRKEDILARTGGDEFCILLPQTTEEEARGICKRIYNDCVSYENRTDKDALYLSISLGYATKTDMGTSVEIILAEAEENMYKQKLLERKSMRSSLLTSIKTTMFEKSHLTAEHEERLVTLAKRVGQAMDLSDVQLSELELLSTLHDLGKLSIDDQILNKPGKLTEEEWAAIKKHPEVGFRIAQASAELAPIAEYILCHHERWDGKGYPQGLEGNAIPLLSRIVSIVDAYDAMTQDRPYRRAMTEDTAVAEITANAGSQFDPNIARLFVSILKGYSEPK